MTEIQKIVFWQPIISPHYVPIMNELSKIFPEVVLVVVKEQDTARREQGWILPDTGAIRVISLERADELTIFENEDGPHVLHIFSGTRGYSKIWKVLKIALYHKSNCAIVGETLDWHGIKGALRYIVSVFDAWRIRNGLKFILAKGTLGVWWYKSVFYPLERIFEWAYFVEDDNQRIVPAIEDQIIRFIYVGRLAPEKGIEWLFWTFQQLKSANFELHIVGDGPLKENCLRWAHMINGTVKFHGQVPISSVRTFYAEKDYLILPSTGKDGWGAVVNEALQYGLQCIVSKKCGASSLMIDKRLGYVIEPSDKHALLLVLQEIFQKSKKSTSESQNYIRAFSQKIHPKSGAIYLNEIIKYSMRKDIEYPLPPWCRNGDLTNLS